MTDLSGQLQALVVSLGYALAIALAVILVFLAAAAASFLLAWRVPKGTHRWPK